MVPFGDDPSRLALENEELLDIRRDGGHDLRGGGAGPDDSHPLVVEVVLVLPAERVELRPLEIVEAGPIRITRCVEETHRADQHVALFHGAIGEDHDVLGSGQRAQLADASDVDGG